MIDWEPRAKELADAVAARGALDDPAWRHAIEQTPRHQCIPRFWDLDQYNSPQTLVDGANPAQRDPWLDACYSDQVLVTHWVDLDGRRAPTSSASVPSLVASMLRSLDVQDGHRVLEVGSGTGWNAALLCHRLGPEQVATIDIDPVIVAEAQAHLRQCGYEPVIEAADGAGGLPQAAPYDRILCTCSAGPVPPAWIEQLADHGRIVAPLTFGGALAVLDKTAPGEVSGRLDQEQAHFMPLHAPGEPVPEGLVVSMPQLGESDTSRDATTGVPLAPWANPDFRLWLALHLPHARIADMVNEQMDRTGIVVYTADQRAQIDYQGSEPGRPLMVQDPDGLWGAVEKAWSTWQQHGEPDRTRIGITARLDGEQWAWLDEPDGPIRWPLPTSHGG